MMLSYDASLFCDLDTVLLVLGFLVFLSYTFRFYSSFSSAFRSYFLLFLFVFFAFSVFLSLVYLLIVCFYLFFTLCGMLHAVFSVQVRSHCSSLRYSTPNCFPSNSHQSDCLTKASGQKVCSETQASPVIVPKDHRDDGRGRSRSR